METITIKMTWENTLPSLLLLLESGDAEGKKTAKEELARMAKAADQAVAAEDDATETEADIASTIMRKLHSAEEGIHAKTVERDQYLGRLDEEGGAWTATALENALRKVTELDKGLSMARAYHQGLNDALAIVNRED